jgi:hypothetical protein
MNEEIMEALRRLGLSDERLAEFSAIVRNVKDRVRSEGLITRRRAKQPAKAAAPGKPRKRRIVLTYKPSGASGRTVGDELALIDARLQRMDRPVPDWQSAQLQARKAVLLRTGKPMATLAKETLAHVKGGAR